MARALLAAALLAGAAPGLAVQPPTPPVSPPREEALDWLVGTWRGAGTMMGRASEAMLSVRPALNGRWREFTYRAGPFEGRAFYRMTATGGWQAHWFDNRGVTFPITAQVDTRTLTSEWGAADTERGRTVYRLAEDGRLHISDSVRRPDGSYREFANHSLTRTNP